MKTLVEKLIESFKANKEILNKACIADGLGYKFETAKAISMISQFENYECITNNRPEIIITNGNPYTTILLCLQAVYANTNIIINIQNTMQTLNTIILKIFNESIKTNNRPKLTSNMTVNQLMKFKDSNKNGEIIVVDDRTKFNELFDLGLRKIKYLAIMSIDLYYDSDDFQEMIETIDEYCGLNYINLNIYENDDINKILINEHKIASSKAILILTKNEKSYNDKINILETKKQIYINYNPFDRIEFDATKLAIKNA